MTRLSPRALPDYLLSTGQNTFSTSDAKALLQASDGAVRKGLARLTRAKQIFSPTRGFYVVIPPEFRQQGAVPAAHFIDAMVRALGRSYYVSLSSAAELHGATAPTDEPQPFQVIVDRHVTDRDLNGTELWFYTSRHAIYDIGTEQHDRPTGPLRLASRELTAIDLVEHANHCGGINHVAALLDALAPFRTPKLVDIAQTRDTSTARRLGYLLSRLDPNLRLGPLQELADLHHPTPTDLAPGAPRRGHIDPEWNVRINAEIVRQS